MTSSWSPTSSTRPRPTIVIGFPGEGPWKLRFNSDWQGYSEQFEGHQSGDVVAEPGEYDGLPFHGSDFRGTLFGPDFLTGSPK